jgi:hypothetical protein
VPSHRSVDICKWGEVNIHTGTRDARSKYLEGMNEAREQPNDKNPLIEEHYSSTHVSK